MCYDYSSLAVPDMTEFLHVLDVVLPSICTRGGRKSAKTLLWPARSCDELDLPCPAS
jgi:hypothetical protein